MKYTEAVKIINDGDMLSIYTNRTSSLIAKAICFWQGENKPYHTCIAMWINDELNVLQIDSDDHNIIPFSRFDRNNVIILRAPKYLKFNKNQMIRKIGEIQYSVFEAAQSGLRQYFKWVPFLNTKNQYCSQYCAQVWNKAGFGTRIPENLDPYELEKFMIDNDVEVLRIETI